MSDKVTIEITPQGWTATATINGNSVTEIWRRAPFGAARQGDESFERAEDAVSEKLYEALSGIVGVASDVMDALR